jgi:hypothetical protein
MTYNIVKINKKAERTTMHIKHTAERCKLEGYVFKLKFFAT